MEAKYLQMMMNYLRFKMGANQPGSSFMQENLNWLNGGDLTYYPSDIKRQSDGSFPADAMRANAKTTRWAEYERWGDMSVEQMQAELLAAGCAPEWEQWQIWTAEEIEQEYAEQAEAEAEWRRYHGIQERRPRRREMRHE
jgi:hypothetical protein